MDQENKSLMALVDQASELEKALIESNGEVTEAIAALLEVNELHLPAKVDGYAFFIDRMDSVETFYNEKAAMFLKLAKSAAAVAARCEFNLKAAMLTLGTDEITGFDVKYKLVKSNPACIIEDDNKIDGSYKITETITKVDKKRIAEDLKLGVPVEGARLEYGQSLRRYANSPTSKKKVVAS